MDINAPDALQKAAEAELDKRDDIAHTEYVRARPSLEITAGALRERCLSRCRDHALFPTLNVSARVKDWVKLLPKIQDGRADPWNSCTDLIGVKIVVLSLNDVQKARTAVKEMVRAGSDQEPKWYEIGPRAKGYQARHVTIDIPAELDVPENTRTAGAELQIVTALQDAWGTFSHDDFYKAREGVPFELAKRALRLAAIMDLADDEIQALRDHIGPEVERKQKQVTDTDDEPSIRLDEVTLIAAAASTMKERFVALRKLGRDAGFQVSGFPELVKPGFEADVFLRLAAETETHTLADLAVRCDEALSQGQELKQIVEELRRSRASFSLFDRPLQVLQASLMLNNANVTPALTPDITAAIGRVRGDSTL